MIVYSCFLLNLFIQHTGHFVYYNVCSLSDFMDTYIKDDEQHKKALTALCIYALVYMIVYIVVV